MRREGLPLGSRGPGWRGRPPLASRKEWIICRSGSNGTLRIKTPGGEGPGRDSCNASVYDTFPGPVQDVFMSRVLSFVVRPLRDGLTRRTTRRRLIRCRDCRLFCGMCYLSYQHQLRTSERTCKAGNANARRLEAPGAFSYDGVYDMFRLSPQEAFRSQS
jgi:hypothetical protein